MAPRRFCTEKFSLSCHFSFKDVVGNFILISFILSLKLQCRYFTIDISFVCLQLSQDYELKIKDKRNEILEIKECVEISQ